MGKKKPSEELKDRIAAGLAPRNVPSEALQELINRGIRIGERPLGQN